MYDHGREILEGREQESDGVGLWYDADRLVLSGVYMDEVTAYRARKRWIDALEKNFLLEERHDFSIKVRPAYRGRHFKVRCDFLTACGRYAFWRLTNHQAPEVQFLLETAHLPHLGMEELEKIACLGDDCDAANPQERHEIVGDRSLGTGVRWGRAFGMIRAIARKVFGSARAKNSALHH
jgi:hypothetical protein